MAILSKGIKLAYSSSGTTSYTDLTDLLEIPSLGGSIDKVDVTTLMPAKSTSMASRTTATSPSSSTMPRSNSLL